MKIIQDVLHEKNPYIRRFKYLLEHDENINDPGAHVVIKADRWTNQHDKGVLNAPRNEDFAAVVSDERLAGLANRDVRVQLKGGDFHYISEKHRSYDPLEYPVILWNGQDGYDVEKKQRKLTDTTSLQFYAYQLMEREDDFNTILHTGKLLSQFVVDMYAKIESERLSFQANQQETLRASSYKGLFDSVQQNKPLDKTGTPVILSPSFVGGPRYMHAKTQDALTYVRVHGRPSLFITMTCSTKWPEIQRELFPGQKTEDREDIVARVFNQKRKSLINAIKTGNFFGTVECFMLSNEWQKRGLPHQHMLVWLAEEIHPSMLDKIISAEIPDPSKDPELYKLMKTWMLHGPCSKNRCIVDGKCNKGFPKPFTKETMSDRDGYPLYRRRKPTPEEGGQSLVITRDSGAIHEYDNRHVVPYNPALLRIFQCHINVEYVASIKSIKYVCKYVNKGKSKQVFWIKILTTYSFL